MYRLHTTPNSLHILLYIYGITAIFISPLTAIHQNSYTILLQFKIQFHYLFILYYVHCIFFCIYFCLYLLYPEWLINDF